MTISAELRSEAVKVRGARLSKVLLTNVVLLTMIAPLATDVRASLPRRRQQLAGRCHRGAVSR